MAGRIFIPADLFGSLAFEEVVAASRSKLIKKKKKKKLTPRILDSQCILKFLRFSGQGHSTSIRLMALEAACSNIPETASIGICLELNQSMLCFVFSVLGHRIHNGAVQ